MIVIDNAIIIEAVIWKRVLMVSDSNFRYGPKYFQVIRNSLAMEKYKAPNPLLAFLFVASHPSPEQTRLYT
jgi:hypothetical protein